MKDKQNLIIVILAVLLVTAVGYIAVTKYQERQIGVFQKGLQAGYEQAVIQLVQQATTCQPVQLRVENKTVDMIAVGCLQIKQGNLSLGS